MRDPFPEAAAHDPGARALRLPADVTATAEYSPCGIYRYKLMHRWRTGPLVMFCMMNPSTASHVASDRTVNKTGQIARWMGFGGQMVGNACAARFTDKNRLLDLSDPAGPRNLAALIEMAAEAEMIVIAHGKLPGKLQVHADAMCSLLRAAGRELHVLRQATDGTPMHPLARGRGFIPVKTDPVVWRTVGP